LVNFSLSRNASAVAICLAVGKIAFIDGAVGPHFDPVSIRPTLGVELTPIHSTARSGFPIKCHQSLLIIFSLI